MAPPQNLVVTDWQLGTPSPLEALLHRVCYKMNEFLLRMYIKLLLNNVNHEMPVELDTHGTVGELRQIIHQQARRRFVEDYGNDDPNKLIFTGKKATYKGAGNHLQITHKDFFGPHVYQDRNVYMLVEKHIPKTTPAQRRAMIEHEDLTLEIGKLRTKLRDMETRMVALNAKLTTETAALDATPTALTSITGKRTRRLENEL